VSRSRRAQDAPETSIKNVWQSGADAAISRASPFGSNTHVQFFGFSFGAVVERRINWKTLSADFESRVPVGRCEGKTYPSPMFELTTTDHAGKGSGAERFFRFPRDPAMWYSKRKRKTLFVLPERAPSERQHIQPTLKLLVHEAMAN
jgi:hypothetical protein